MCYSLDEIRLRRWSRVTVQRLRRRKELLNLFFLASKLSVEATRARKMVAVRHNLRLFARGALLGKRKILNHFKRELRGRLMRAVDKK